MKKRHSKKQLTYKENYVFGGVFAEDPLDIYNILVEYDDEGIRAELPNELLEKFDRSRDSTAVLDYIAEHSRVAYV